MSYLVTSNLKNYKSTVATTVLSQSFTSNAQSAAVSGSLITYTPQPAASHIIYRTQFAFGYDGDSPFLSLCLQDDSGGSFSNIAGYTYTNSGYVNSQENIVSVMSVLPSWTGPRSLRINAVAYLGLINPTIGASHGYRTSSTLHALQSWDGSSTVKYFYPSVSCISVINGDP